MGISLNGLTPAGTYPGLIKTGDNTAISGTTKVLSDGNGNDLPMEVSTTGVNLTGSPTVNAVAIANTTQLATKQDTLVSGTNIKTINGTSVLGSGDIAVVTAPSGVSGAIQFSNGSAFASDAANLFWDDTNKSLGIGGVGVPAQINLKRSLDGALIGYIKGENNGVLISTGTNVHQLIVSNAGIGIGIGAVGASARLHVKGSGTTSATTSLLVQNSAASTSLQLTDDGRLNLPLTGLSNRSIIVGGSYIGFRGDSNKLIGIEADGFVYYDGSNRFKVDTSGNVTVYGELNMNSTTKGFLPPRMTTTQKNAIASPAAGLVVYDSTTNKLQCYNGSTWNDLF